MKRTLIALTAGGILLTGCSPAADDSAADETTEPQAVATITTTAAAATTTGTPLNSRGNREKDFGELSGSGCFDGPGNCAVEWTLGAPIDATNCSDLDPIENGRVIAVPINVQTGTGQDMGPFNAFFNPYSFSALRGDGVTVPNVSTSVTYQCDESDSRIPSDLAPASKYEGFIVLDVPSDAQSVIFHPDVSEDGWEWPLT
ncbi:hypothetical protein [Rhodococcoides fascians]|uniref:hypothetical protein n=1 Tax=Rhodococcoides fascians TaxID=1828 RepID=UPI0012D2FC7A|nr:hypothetical protein [Rhodococcus fascians]